MKIAVNATILDDKPTGLGMYTLHLLRNLSAIAPDCLTIYTDYASALDGQKVEVVPVGSSLQPKYGKIAGVRRFLWTQFIFPVLLQQKHFDIIYHTSHYLLLFTHKRQIITIHDLLPLKYPARHRLQYYYFRFVMPVLLCKAYRIIAVSENTKRDICKYYKISHAKVTVVYNGCDVDLFNRKAGAHNISEYIQGEYVLFIGASYIHKNGERAIEAFSKISGHTKLRLLVVGGRRQYLDVLQKKVAAMNFDDRVKFVPYVPPEDLVALYRGASMLLFPSLYEGFGIPPLEAMACGCPVVASRVSSIPEVCGEAAYYVDPYNYDNIAEGIQRVLSDETLRADMILKGLERVKSFSWEKSAQHVIDIFKGR